MPQRAHALRVAPIFGPRYVAKLARSTAATLCARLLAIFRKLTATWHTRVFQQSLSASRRQGGSGPLQPQVSRLKFWQLRREWFRLRRALGLPGSERGGSRTRGSERYAARSWSRRCARRLRGSCDPPSEEAFGLSLRARTSGGVSRRPNDFSSLCLFLGISHFSLE
jgi:hypothetical protein